MRLINLRLFLLVLALLLPLSAVSAGEKFKGALSIEQIEKLGFKFLQSGKSGDGESTRWVFMTGTWKGMPIIVDVKEKPSQTEIDIANVAAFAEARFIYEMMKAKLSEEKEKLSGPKLDL